MSSCWFRSNSLSRVQQGSCTPQRCKAKKRKKITVLKSPFDLQCLPSRKLKLKTLISWMVLNRVHDLQVSSQFHQYIYSLALTPKSSLRFPITFVYSEISALYGHFALLSGFLTSFHLPVALAHFPSLITNKNNIDWFHVKIKSTFPND